MPGALKYLAGVWLAIAVLTHWHPASAQGAGGPSANCHVTDGSFTQCPNKTREWADIAPIPFPATDAFLYVNQDAAHAFLYLLYDFPFRTSALAASDSVQINFDTVEQSSAGPSLVLYDISVFGNNQLQVLQQGKPTPAGRIVAAVGFGTSPNSATPHVIAELQVPLVQGPPGAYSSDPLFWNASVPPGPPPNPCPTQPGKTFNDCVKKYASIGGTVFTLSGIGAGVAGFLCTAGTIGGCAPAEAALVVGGGISAALGYLLDKYIAGDPPGFALPITPDPNYTQLAQPATYAVPPPLSGVPQAEAAALTAWYSTLEQAIALAQAGITSIARAEGAAAAGSPVWVTKQTQAAQGFGGQLGGVLGALPAVQTNLLAAFQAAGASTTFTAATVQTFLNAIAAGAPASEIKTEFGLAEQTLTQLGFTSADQALIMQIMQGSDPNGVANLGTGAFPASLADAVIPTAEQQLGPALLANVPASNALSPSFNITLPGDYVAAGVGLRGTTSGNITLSGIPAGATVQKAFLYWGMLDNGEDPALHQLSVNGKAVAGSLLGSGPDTCWGLANSFTYRADVTTLVNGNGVYALTGVATGGNILAEGASLVVIYSLAGAPVKTVILDDGNISLSSAGALQASAGFSAFAASAPVTAATSFIVGDGQGTQFGFTPTSFTGSAGTQIFASQFASLDGPLWDTSTFGVSSVIGAGSSAATANISVSDDCLLWSAQAFSVTSTPQTTPVIATAAVVQAGASGDTIANLRGLSPADAPTVQDLVQMVVQFRTIQTPSVSAPGLTNELVQGLVNDGVISPSAGSQITASILQNIAPVPVSFSGSPGAANCSTQSLATLQSAYGANGLAAMAATLGYKNIWALLAAIQTFCK